MDVTGATAGDATVVAVVVVTAVVVFVVAVVVVVDGVVVAGDCREAGNRTPSEAVTAINVHVCMHLDRLTFLHGVELRLVLSKAAR